MYLNFKELSFLTEWNAHVAASFAQTRLALCGGSNSQSLEKLDWLHVASVWWKI